MRFDQNIYQNKVAEIRKEHNLLRELLEKFKVVHKLTPCFGAELEFYIHGDIDISKFEYKIKDEKGKNQYEIDLAPSEDVIAYAECIDNARENVIVSANTLGGKADFSPKPFSDDYGSAMHMHLNFLEDYEVEKYAKILCHFLPITIDAYLPNNEAYKRLDSKFMAPTHISYGGNNRSVLIRIPDAEPKRLEHRLASSDADPFLVMHAMLHSIDMGLEDMSSITKLEKTYGNAYDEQYGLKAIEAQAELTKER